MNQIIYLLITLFWIFAIVECIRNEYGNNRLIWIAVLIFLYFISYDFPIYFIGAIAYFLVRRLPGRNGLPNYFARWTRRREIWTAEANASNIGKAHQFVILGNLLCDLDMYERAEDAFKTALEKEPDNTQALWGNAFIDMRKKRFESARSHLEKLLKLDPRHRSGDASLAYSKMLVTLKDWDAADTYLQEDLKQWGHAETYLMLAELRAQQGKTEEARDYLKTMRARLQGSTIYHYKRNKHLVRKAEKLLKSIGKS